MGCSYIERQAGNAALPESVGEFAEIVILSDKQTLEIVKPGLDSSLGQEVPGLYPPELLYKKRIADESYFKGFFQKHCQVVILLHPGNWPRFKNIFGKKSAELIEKKLTDSTIWYFVTKDIWSKPQTVHFVVAKNAIALNQILIAKAQILIEKAIETETAIGIERIFSGNAHRDTFFQKMLAKKNFAVHKAPSYRIAADKADFTWLRKSTRKCDYGIIITEEPYQNQNQFKTSYIITQRNKTGEKNIRGEEDNTYMGTDSHLEPVSIVSVFNGMYCTETRGWWKLENDFMGGPFVVYTIFDEKRNRVITLEGNVYAPHEEKVKRLRELEVIMHTLIVK
jgi:hypothetical protein